MQFKKYCWTDAQGTWVAEAWGAAMPGTRGEVEVGGLEAVCGQSGGLEWVVDGAAGGTVWADDFAFTGAPCSSFVDGDHDGSCPQGADLDGDGTCLGPAEVGVFGARADCDDGVFGPKTASRWRSAQRARGPCRSW